MDPTAQRRHRRLDAEGMREMAGSDEALAVHTTTAEIEAVPTWEAGQGRSPRGDEESDPRPGNSDWDRNDAGRATAMTLLSRLQGWGAPWLRLLLWVFRHFLRVRPLRELSFIHFAHWSVLEGLTVDRAGTAGTRRERYLLFESNFNGTWHEYIDAFSQVVGVGIHAILAGCEGFPGLMPTRGFKPFIEHHEFVADHYYSAYPAASATMIRAALELGDDMATLRNLASGADDAKFARTWGRLLATPRVQANLAGQACTQPGLSAYLHQLAFGRKNVAGNTYAFCALLPIRSGEVDALRTHLRGLPRDGDSPLAKVPGTHFGRWVVLDKVFHDSWPEQYEPLDPAYLLFTAVFDTRSRDAVGAYLNQLVSVLGTEQIWEKCLDWPTGSAAQERIDYLRHYQRDVHFLFSAYPGSVEEIHRALADRKLLIGFSRQAQSLAQYRDEGRLRAAFAAALDGSDRSADREEGR